MIFTSLQFVEFFLVVYLLYRLLPHRGQNWMLLIASYVFYGWLNPWFVLLMFFITAVNYICGRFIATAN